MDTWIEHNWKKKNLSDRYKSYLSSLLISTYMLSLRGMQWNGHMFAKTPRALRLKTFRDHFLSSTQRVMAPLFGKVRKILEASAMITKSWRHSVKCLNNNGDPLDVFLSPCLYLAV